MDWARPWLIAISWSHIYATGIWDGILFCLPVAARQDAGSSINSWADQVWGEIKTTESPGNISQHVRSGADQIMTHLAQKAFPPVS
jgi:hypothetical protein